MVVILFVRKLQDFLQKGWLTGSLISVIQGINSSVRTRYLAIRPRVVYSIASLILIFSIPADNEITGEERGRKLNTKMMMLPYFRILDSAFRYLRLPMSLLMMLELNEYPMR
jgi:hypothetical protein